MLRVSSLSWIRLRALGSSLAAVTLLLGLSVAAAPPASAAAGETWTARTAAEANNWRSVTYGNGVFVAVVSFGTNRVMTSTNGETWTKRSAAEANAWNSVTYGNGVFVAVAITGTNRVMTSPDGVTWTARSAAEANQWQSVTYGNGVFVAVATTGTNRVMTSPDGVTWTARSAAEASAWTSVTYGNGVFVAMATVGSIRVMTSPDGVTWTARSASEQSVWTSVTYGNGVFVAVASFGTNRVMTSTNGETWTARSAAEANAWNSVTYGNGVFVAVASDGSSRVMTSADGETWTARTAAAESGWFSVAYGNGVFVAVARSGTDRVMTSGVYVPPISAPAAPTSLVATSGSGSASIAFTPGADGGASISKYQYTINDGGSWSDAVAGTTSPVSITGLTNGTTYSIKLRAVNNAGGGTASDAVSVTPRTTPAAPTFLVATAGVGSASIVFTAGADGGASISKFQYQLGSGSWVDAVGTASPITLSGLTNGTSYSIKLRAVNTAGDGVASDAVSVTPRTVPGAPTVSSVTPGNSTVSVAFTAGSTGGSVITGYEYQLNGSGSWFSLGTTSSPASIGVTNGVAYTVKLRAVNVAGSGAASDASGSFTPRTTPSAPTGLSATPGSSFASVTPGNASASIAFAPGTDGGASITKYQYKVGSGSWTDAVGTTSPITVSGLTNYTNNSIRLRAVNSAGAGVASAAVSVTPRQEGLAVTSATPSGSKGIVVRFNLNPLPGTTVAYQSVVAYEQGTTTVAGSCRTYATRTTCYVGGLTRATTYDLRVTAHLPVPGKTWHNTTFEGSILQVRTNN